MDQLMKLNVQVKPSLSLIKVFKLSLDNLFPSLLASLLLLLVILILLTTTSSLWMLVVVLLLMDSTMRGIFSPLRCTWQINLISQVKSRCTSTKLTLMSVVAIIMHPRSRLEVLKINNSLKKFQSTSLHVMNLVWFSITAHPKMEQFTKLSLVHEHQAHDWDYIFSCLFKELFVFLWKCSQIRI